MAEQPDGPAHEPVLVAEVTRLLAERPMVLDLTLGAGGHAEALLEAGTGRVLGVDRDPEAIRMASDRLARFGDRFRAVLGRFSEPPELEGPVDGVLYDLGVSSMQLDRPERGFSYRQSGPLDMRMGPDARSAMDLVNAAPEEELARILYEYGEERRSRRVAGAIVRARTRAPIRTTDELARVVAGALGAQKGRAHPARRTFQALRISANEELDELAASLPKAAELLAPGGRLVVISYHSLEDRLTKRFFLSNDKLEILTKKPITPSKAEAARNPRSRSAKLRAADKLVSHLEAA